MHINNDWSWVSHEDSSVIKLWGRWFYLKEGSSAILRLKDWVYLREGSLWIVRLFGCYGLCGDGWQLKPWWPTAFKRT